MYKQLGRRTENIPVPLKGRKQLIMSMRLCAMVIKTNLRGSLRKRIYTHLRYIGRNKKTILDQAHNSFRQMIKDSRFNLRYR